MATFRAIFFFTPKKHLLLFLLLGVAGRLLAQPSVGEGYDWATEEEALYVRADMGCGTVRDFMSGYDQRAKDRGSAYVGTLKVLLLGVVRSHRLLPSNRGEALSYYRTAFGEAEKQGFSDLAARASLGIAEEFLRAYVLDSAFVFLQNAEGLFSGKNADRLRAEAERLYAGVYRTMSDSAKAFAHYRKAEAILDSLPASGALLRLRARLLQEKGQALEQFHLSAEAVACFEKALDIRQNNGFVRETPLNHCLLASSLSALQRPLEAGPHFGLSEKGSRDSCLAHFRAAILGAYAGFVQRSGQPARALEMALESGQLAKISGDDRALVLSLRVQAESQFALGRYQAAYEASVGADVLRDSLNKEINARTIKELESRQQAVAKMREMDVLNHELKERSNKNYYLSVFSAMVLLLLLMVFLYSINRARVSRQLHRQALALANAHYTKDRLFSVVAHDLRSPLQALQTLLENEKRFRAVGHDVDALLNRLQKKVADTRDLLDTLLLWAAQETQELKADLRPTDLRQLLQQELQQQREDALLKDITLLLDAPDGPMALADANMVRFVVRNLVSNALKFTPSKGLVSVALRVDEARRKSCISVRDTGPGFTPQALPAQQNQFDPVAERGNLSHGLGLMLTRAFLAQHGSELHIESEEGKGAHISFCLEWHEPD